MKKLLLSVFLLLLLLVLVACGGDGEPQDTTAPGTTAPGTTAAPAVTTAPLTGEELLSALSPYITLSREDYYGLSVTIPLPSSVTDENVGQYIDRLLLGYAEYKTITEGVVAEGDRLDIYYRGEVKVGEEWVEFVGGSNLHNLTPYPLTIGSGAFIPGFEDGLLGLGVDATALTPSADASLVAGEGGNTVLYITYDYKYETADGVERTGYFSDRIDLSAASGRYVGSALPAALTGKSVGTKLTETYTVSFDIDGDLLPDTLTLSGVRLTHILTEEETFCVNLSFPESYPNSPALAGKEARFHVAVMEAARPVPPALTYELMTGKMGLTAEALTPFIPEGAVGTDEEKLLLAFRPYVKDVMTKSLREEIYTAALNAFWMMMGDLSATAYPETLVSDMIDDLSAMVMDAYLQSGYGGGMAYNEFVYAYLGEGILPEGLTDVEEMLRIVARREVKCRLILYYIAAAEGWELTATERTEGYEAYMQELLDYYNQSYGGTLTRQDLIDAGYTREYVLEEMLRSKVHDALFETMREHIVYEGE